MLFEIHMLKNFPATNLNRDETGAPKTCYFGGSQRGRISSQCLKRSWRTSELFGALESRGWRSRNLPEMVAKKLREMNVDEAYMDPAKLMLTGIANKDKTVSNDLITGQIIFFSPEDVQALADTVKALTEQYEDVQKFTKLKPDDIIGPMKKAQARAITLDIALFGRMVTSDIILNVEASMQVAHAVSTHPVNLESDYFTAVDDLIHMMDEGGAGIVMKVQGQGFGGKVPCVVAFDMEGTIIGVKFLENSETKGYGSRLYEDSSFAAQFAGMPAESFAIGDIDALAGATVSSKAAVEALNTAIDTYNQLKEGM